MCPVCIATVTLIAADATSTGGINAIAMFRRSVREMKTK
jgi:hypothetical protein